MLEDAPHNRARLLHAKLSDFDISETRGFLPEQDPVPLMSTLRFVPLAGDPIILARNLSKYLAGQVGHE